MQPIVIHADRAFTPFEEISDAVIVIQGSKISAVGQRGKVDLPRGAREIHARRENRCAGLCRCPHSWGWGARRDGGHARGAGNNYGHRRSARHYFPGGHHRYGQRKGNVRQRGGHRAFHPQYEPIPARELSAEILGIHFEGPFISPARRGVHPAKWIVPPSRSCSRSSSRKRAEPRKF